MSRIRVVLSVVLVAFVVLALALFLRPGMPETLDQPQIAEQRPVAEPVTGVMMAKNGQNVPVFGFPDRTYRPSVTGDDRLLSIDVDAVYREFKSPQLGRLQAVQTTACYTQLEAQRAPLAMVDLTLNAPCKPNTQFEIEQGVMIVSVMTDDEGRAQIRLPALAFRTSFAALSQNVEHHKVNVIVPQIRNFDRVALGWRGKEQLQLHAFENGSFIGGPGHVWTGSGHLLEDAIAGNSGYIHRLDTVTDDSAYHAEVYTFPAGRRMADGTVNLQVANLLHASNCAREVDFTVLQVTDGNNFEATALSPKMPACNQIGFAVLLTDDLPTMIAKAR